MEERGILGKRMNSDCHCAENYHPHRKKKIHSGLVNSNKEETVLLSEFKQLLKQIKKEIDNYEDEIPKKLIGKSRVVFNDYAVNLFKKLVSRADTH